MKIAGFTIPDSPLALDALELATQAQPQFLLNHCVRSFLFAQAIGQSRGEKFDSELLFVSSVLHDIALASTEKLSDRFEISGADRADEFLLARGVSGDRRSIVWDAIALHTSVAIALRNRSEVRLAALGIALDFAGGIQLRLLDRSEFKKIVEEIPRLDFKRQMTGLLVEAVRRSPKTIPGSFLADIAHTHAPEIRCPHVHEMIANAPFTE